MLRKTALLLLLFALSLSASASAQFVGSSKSDKYHSESCRHVKRINTEDRVEFKTVDEALDAGYVACKVCKPSGRSTTSESTGTSTTTTVDQKASGNAGGALESSGRCQATTKKGTQCKRNAASGSKYCWQHGG